MKIFKVAKYGFLIIGSGMLIGVIFIYINTKKFINDSIKSKGTVIQLLKTHSKSSSDKPPMYTPLVRFTENKGNIIKFSTSTSSYPSHYEVGEKVNVIYNPKNPNEAKINDFFSLWSGILMFGMFGALFFQLV